MRSTANPCLLRCVTYLIPSRVCHGGLLQELKLPYDIVASDVEAPDAQDMLLLATYLFTTLPQLAPRTTVDLASRLGDGQVGWVLGEMVVDEMSGMNG